MLRAWYFIRDYWYIPVLAVGVFGTWIVWNKWTSKSTLPPVQKILDEVSAIGAKRETREVQLTHGAEAAKKHVNEKYAETRRRLDAEASAKVQELEDDPVALAAYLDRVSGGER